MVEFYRDALGLTVLGRLESHDGIDGAMLGHREAGYHLEFTCTAGHTAGRAPTGDNLLVFYLPDGALWQRVVDRLEMCGHPPVAAVNSFWDREGLTFEDPYGYRVVLVKGRHVVW